MSKTPHIAAENDEAACSMRVPFLVIDNFLPIDMARHMRKDIEAHFSAPGAHRAETHQIWNYWFVPGLYTYLRTMPDRVIRKDLVRRFSETLQGWSTQTLGLQVVTPPVLSLYVGGCRQGIHNDSANGRIAFVYSLTNDQRKTIGGETLIFHEGDGFRLNLRSPAAGQNFYSAIEPRFNRLVLFDDRIPHAVERVEGSMDPLEGRFVLHGHLREGAVIVEGPLPAEAVHAVVREIVGGFHRENRGVIDLFHGPLSLRFSIASQGHVKDIRVLLDRVIEPNQDADQFLAFRRDLISRLKLAKFPEMPKESVIILPVLFGGSLPPRPESRPAPVKPA